MSIEIIKQENFVPEIPTPLFNLIIEDNPYPVDSLGSLSEVAYAMHDMSKAPIAIACQSVLSIMSLCVQSLKNVQTLGGYKPCSVYALTVSESGERKTACDDLLMDGVYEAQMAIGAIIKQAKQKFQVKYEAWKAQKEKIIKNFKQSKTISNLNLEQSLESLGAEPKQPVDDIIITTDPTFEGLFMLFVTGRPSLGLFTDEGGLFLGGHSMNKDNKIKTISGLSKFWDGSPLNRTRVSTPVETLYNKRLASHILLQPAIANILLGDVIVQSQGITGRFLITRPQGMAGYRPETDFKPQSKIIVDKCKEKIKQHILRPLHLEENSVNNLIIGKIHLTDTGKELLKAFHREIDSKLREDGEYYLIKPYASKAVEQACRIAGVLTLFDNPDAEYMLDDNVKNAIVLMRYYLKEALLIANGFIIPPHLQKAEKLRKWLIQEYAGDFINVRLIMQRANGNFRGSAEEVRKNLYILEEHGWIIKSTGVHIIDGHKSKETWRVFKSLT